MSGDEPFALGGLVMLEGRATAQVMAVGGYDFLMVDVQHSPFSGSSFADVVAAVRGTDTAVIARVAPGRPDQIEWVLDQGADGVMVPLVNTVEEAKTAVAACRYPPLGRRSVGGVANMLLRGPEYVAEADDDVVCIIQIEHFEGVQNLDAILSVPGIDAVTPGHVDLARSLGHVADYSSGISYKSMPEVVQEALASISKTAEGHGVPVMPVAGSLSEVKDAVANGVRMLFCSGDFHLLTQAVAANVSHCRAVLESTTK